MAIAPTLLIGLGGIGCRIVDKVYSQLPEGDQGQVLVHGFDTNINDISELEHLGHERITQTSQNWSVSQYLNGSERSVTDWFPSDSPELLRKTLTDGAGQIRAVSRLAYRAALDAGALNKLEQQINILFRANTNALNSSVRIMIVNSIAGGTGAGLFLQIALFLRQLLQEKHGRTTVLVRGAFVLPDVLINTKTIDQNEYDNIRANAYACLKELDAITSSARGVQSDQGTVTIELEFRPDQTDSLGHRDFSIPPFMLPYDFSFLFDFENTGHFNLGALDPYINQVVDSTFLQLFSPFTGALFSVEDNKILSLIETEGRNRYAGCGVATMTYPYEEMISYCALSWASDILGDQWLKLDQLYDEELRVYERDLQQGVSRERPVLSNRYVWLIDDFASSERPEPFFNQIQRQAYLEGKKGDLGELKAQAFLNAVDSEIARIISNDQVLAEQQGRCRVDDGLIKVRERAINEISRVEDDLDVVKQQVLRFIPDSRTSLVNRILVQDCDVENHLQGEDCRLNTWLLNRPEPLHPVAIRYTLYRILLILDQQIALLSPKNQQTLKNIESYSKTYDLVETEDHEEDAHDRIRLALKQPIFSRIFNNHFKEFVDEYIEKSSKQIRLLTDYLQDGLKESVYREIREAIGGMIEDWERYFANLRHVRNEIMAEKLQRQKEHEQLVDPTQLFVLAGSDVKKSMWEELRPRLVQNNLSTDISREIYLSQYKRYCERCYSGKNKRWQNKKVGQMFRSSVLTWCELQLRKQDKLDLNVVSALRNEAEIMGKNAEQHVLDRIASLNQLAQPFIQGIPGAQKIECWGLHSDTNKALNENDRQTLFAGHDNVSDAFSRHRILRYTSIYGLKAEDLDKFSAGDESTGKAAGVYYKAYKKRILQLQEHGNTVTPHLDKRWHLPAYMPDLNSNLWLVERNKIQRSLILGRVYGYVRMANEDGKPYWFYYGSEGSQSIKRDGKRVDGKTYLLHQALSHNPALVDKILQRARDQAEKDRQAFPEDLSHHQLWKMSLESNILESIFSYSLDNPADGSLREKASNELLPAVIDELTQYAIQALGNHRENAAKQKVSDLLILLRDGSETYRKADNQSMEFLGWQTCLDSALNNLKTS